MYFPRLRDHLYVQLISSLVFLPPNLQGVIVYRLINWLVGNSSQFKFITTHPFMILRVTSHTRLRAHDHYTSSTLISGKGGDGPSSLHTTLEGPTEYVNARWM
jgi:hypothetical protein